MSCLVLFTRGLAGVVTWWIFAPSRIRSQSAPPGDEFTEICCVVPEAIEAHPERSARDAIIRIFVMAYCRPFLLPVRGRSMCRYHNYNGFVNLGVASASRAGSART